MAEQNKQLEQDYEYYLQMIKSFNSSSHNPSRYYVDPHKDTWQAIYSDKSNFVISGNGQEESPVNEAYS